ncbi:hypothetical protein ANCCEY_00145 [Ancylostoma ceylanicum]|uniref:Uncharacterized protein n=1 Tax=Ancylostoma ceylanicum TaxID=53326 RepID=A0A0D6M999_9BILA|nr:hypothetical protein ANCCEY_00145 [Ancylostoma ceylanicum]
MYASAPTASPYYYSHSYASPYSQPCYGYSPYPPPAYYPYPPNTVYVQSFHPLEVVLKHLRTRYRKMVPMYPDYGYGMPPSYTQSPYYASPYDDYYGYAYGPPPPMPYYHEPYYGYGGDRCVS